MNIQNPAIAFLEGDKFDLGELSGLTLIDILYLSADNFADSRINFINSHGDTDFISYAYLLCEAKKFAIELQKNGIHQGSKVILQYRSNKDFIIAIWGSILNGVVPILYKALKSYVNNDTELEKFYKIGELLDNVVVICPVEVENEVKGLQQNSELQQIRFVPINYIENIAADYVMPIISAQDVAVLLPTSGSTGTPKLVEQTHLTLLSMSLATILDRGLTPATISLNWMPLDHVGGIVMFHFLDVILGASHYHVETEYILSDPIKLIHLLSDLKANITWSPNFSFKLVLDALTVLKNKGNELHNVDLSCVKHMVNAGEPINKKTVKDFLDTFKAYGLMESAMCPAWGMSETCSGAVFSKHFSIDALSDSANISVGTPIPGISIRIVNAEDKILNYNEVGEFQVRGPSVTTGYFLNEEETNKAFTKDNWFRTGDLGVINEHGLSIVGRSKEIIIINGSNLYPQDIEAEIEKEVVGLETSYTAAITVTNPEDMRENIIVLFVSKDNSDINDLKNKIIRVVVKKFGFRPLDALNVTHGDIIKTSIGKLQRALIKAKVLPNLQRSQKQNLATAIMPSITGIEGIVLNVYKQYFAVNDIDSSQDFFMLGGDSIACFQIAKELRDQNINIAGSDIFEHTVIVDLVEYIKSNNLILTTPDVVLNYVSDESYNEDIPTTDLQYIYHLGESRASTLDGITAKSIIEIAVDNLDVPKFKFAVEKVLSTQKILRGFIHNNKWKIVTNSDIRAVFRDFTDKDTLVEAMNLSSSIWPLFKIDIYKNKGKYLIRLAACLVLMDGLSIKNFLAQLNAIYNDISTTDVEFGYISYVKNIELMQTSKQFLTAKNYWTNKLAEINDYPALPISGNKILLNKIEQSSYSLKINQQVWKLFKLHAKYNHVTTSMALYAIFAKILALWSNTEAFSVNVLNINRTAMHPDINKQIGNFSNIILFDTKVPALEKFDECVKRLQKAYLLDMEHNTYSGINLITERNKLGGQGNERFPVAFTSATNYGEFYDGFGEIKSVHADVPYVLLDFIAFEHKDVLQMLFTANTQILDKKIVKAMMQAMEKTIINLANLSSWNTCINVLPKAQLIVRDIVNTATMTQLPAKTLLQAFLDNVDKLPKMIALRYEDKSYSYEDLYKSAVSLAKQIRGMAMFEESKLIAILMDKCPEQIIAILAIFISGKAYLPISAKAPIDRIKDILVTANSNIVITQSNLVNEINSITGVEIILTDGKNQNNVNINGIDEYYHAVLATDLAYVIFTSGSTGKPKGVMLTHCSVMNTIIDINTKFSVSAADKFFALSDVSFDLSVYDIFGAFYAGGTIILPDTRIVQDPPEICKLLVHEQITIWNSVPAYMQMVIEDLLNIDQGELALKLIMLSGDWISVKLARQLTKYLPACQTVSLGGATEASIWSNYFVITHIPKSWSSIPYGKPLANQRYYVLNQNFADCPDYVSGELYIAGNGLASGYWKDEEKTTDRFTHHPITHERLYRTGDYGRYWSDGNLEFQGRVDSQVKINGFLVEITEIEGLIATVGGVKQNIVMIRDSHNGEKLLVAYLVLVNPELQEKTIVTIKAQLKKKLPYYMQVAHYVVVDDIALSQNGKVDKKLLPIPQFISASADKVKPSNAIEIKLANLWHKVLGVNEISIHDNFYTLGGHSLAAITLINSINKAFSVKFNINQLIGAPTIYEQAQLLTINDSAQLENKRIIQLNRSNASVAVVFIHPVGGQITSYMNLTQLLPDFCCYGIAQHSYGDDVTVQKLAKEYAKLIKTQIDVPVILVGWSFGGLIAHEMAVLLSEAKHNLLHTVMLDTHLPLNFDTSILTNNAVIVKFIHDLEAQLQIKLEYQVNRNADEILSSVVNQLNQKSDYEFDLQHISKMYQCYQSNIYSMSQYQLSKSIKDVTLIKANNFDSNLVYINPDNANDQKVWQKMSPNMDIIAMEGDHYSIVVGSESKGVVNFINQLYREIM